MTVGRIVKGGMMESRSGNKRIHLGVLFGTLISFCQYRIWDGLVEYAKQNDISLTAYFGSHHTSSSGFVPHYETCMESIRSNSSLDGVIISSSSVTTDMQPEHFKEYIEKIPKHLPIVSISFPLPGIPSVSADCLDGVYTMVSHLIQRHGKRKIAFIKGPDRTWEAEERLEGYKKALAEGGIDFDENYVLRGNYLEESGAAAATELLDNRQLRVDAIAVSNDAMAAGVLRELKSRNIQVPEDIAITGFDDDVISWKVTPAITTVQQDFFKLGMVSAEIMHKIINQKPVEEVNLLPAIPVIRQSCGCFEGNLLGAEPELDQAPAGAHSLLSFALLKIIPLLQESAPAQEITQWITSVVDILKEEPFSKDKLQHRLYEISNDYKRYSEERYVWCEVLHTLIMGVLYYRDEVDNMQLKLSALIAAMTLMQDVLNKEKQAQDYEANEFRMKIGWVANSLVSTFDIDSLAEELCKLLPKLFIGTALICLYRDRVPDNNPDAERELAAVLGYDFDSVINIKRDKPADTLPFDYSVIEGFDFDRERRTMLFYPLFFGNEELGVALLSFDSRVPMDVYARLRIDISTAVKGASLMSKISALSITDELTGLLNRRGFFQHSLSTMKFMGRGENPQIPVVLFLDLDRLKAINDNFGHKEGDTAISTFARIIKESLRETDVIGRLGGDEFAIFSSVDSEASINQMERRLQERIDEYNSRKLHPYKLSTSIGSAVLNAMTIQSLEAAIQRADNFLYEEKRKKRQ